MFNQKLIRREDRIEIDSSGVNQFAGVCSLGLGLALALVPCMRVYDFGLEETMEGHSRFLIYLSAPCFLLFIICLLLKMKAIVSTEGIITKTYSFCGYSLASKEFRLSTGDQFLVQKKVARGQHSNTEVFLVSFFSLKLREMVSIAKSLDESEANKIKEELERFLTRNGELNKITDQQADHQKS